MAPPSSSLDVLHRQLEGRWEHVERARERCATLQRLLKGSSWWQELRRHPELPREMRQEEAALQEVLAAVEQRGRGERWGPGHPGWSALQDLAARRATLQTLMYKRLARPPPSQGAWDKALESLDAVARQPVPSPPGPHEFVLVEGRAFSGFQPGHFWVTPERLVWRPWRREPEQVTLAALKHGFFLSPFELGVTVEGARRFTLFPGRIARPLESLLNVLSRPTVVRREGRVQDVFVIAADGHDANYPSELTGGLALFSTTFVAFLPARRLTVFDHLRRWVGWETVLPLSPELLHQEALVEHLRPMTGAAFESVVRELAQARGGWFWTAREVRRMPDEEDEFRFWHERWVLRVPSSTRRAALPTFLEAHLPGVAQPGPKRPEATGWKGFFDHSFVFTLGALAYYLLLALAVRALPYPMNRVIDLLGQVPLCLVFMRYLKARGFHPLLGLVMPLLFRFFSPLLVLMRPRKRHKPQRRRTRGL